MTDMTIQSRFRIPLLCTTLTLAFTLAGCTITTRDHGSKESADKGKNEDVDIRTPFGSLSVRQGSMDARDAGLSAYPGAQIKKSTDHDGDSSANVNISSSMFGMKVVALKYSTNDSADKVLAFYRKDLSKYGKVLDCQGSFNMNVHPHDKNGKNGDSEVTCDRDNKGDGEYKQELKVGTENNQRIVAVKPVGEGSEFAVVYVRTHGDKDTM
jgi:hypothetical protein